MVLVFHTLRVDGTSSIQSFCSEQDEELDEEFHEPPPLQTQQDTWPSAGKVLGVWPALTQMVIESVCAH